MRCIDFNEQISFYIDELLSERETLDFEEHMTQCEACREAYLTLQNLVLNLNDLDELDLPEGFEAELEEKLLTVRVELKKEQAVEAINKKRPWYRSTLAYRTAAVFVMMAVGMSVLTSQWPGAPKMAVGDYQNTSSVYMKTAEAPTSDSAGTTENYGVTVTSPQPTEFTSTTAMGKAAVSEAPKTTIESDTLRNATTPKDESANSAIVGGSGTESFTNPNEAADQKNGYLGTGFELQTRTVYEANVTPEGDTKAYLDFSELQIGAFGGILTETKTIENQVVYTFKLPQQNFNTALSQISNTAQIRETLGLTTLEIYRKVKVVDLRALYGAEELKLQENPSDSEALDKLTSYQSEIRMSTINIILKK